MPTQTAAQKKAAAEKKATAAKAAAEKAAAELAALDPKDPEEGPRIFEMHGVTLELPRKVPFKLLRVMRGNTPETAVGADFALDMLAAVIGEEQLERIFDADLSMDDGLEVATGALDALGLSSGKSSASSDS
ncbi:MAG: hypothetical protein PGN13_16365 [Patulibacter minatonensis]